MNTREGRLTAKGGLTLYWKAWLPDGMPKAVVHVIHGYAENVGRYGNIVNELVPAGYAIFVNDHRGHGKSGGWPSAGPTCKAVAVTLRSLRVAQQGLIMLRLVQSSNLMALYKTLRG